MGITTRQVQDFLQAQALRKIRESPTLMVEKPLRPRYPNHWWRLDFVVLNEREVSDEDGLFKYVLVVDVFSRYLWTFPIATNVQISLDGPFRNLVDNRGVLPCRVETTDGGVRRRNCLHTLIPYLHWLFLTEGAPEILQGDREFASNAMASLCRRYGVSLINSRAVTPQTNGRVERINRSFKTLLTAYQLERRNYSWVQTLLELTSRYNRTVHSATGQPPIKVYKGKDPRVHERLRGLDGLVTRDEREGDSLERLFSPDKPFLESLPLSARLQYAYEAVRDGQGDALLREDTLAEVRRLSSASRSVTTQVRAYNDWSADKMLCRAMWKHPTAVLRVGQVVRVRNRKNRGFKGPLGHWSPELYLIVSAAEDAVGAPSDTLPGPQPLLLGGRRGPRRLESGLR